MATAVRTTRVSILAWNAQPFNWGRLAAGILFLNFLDAFFTLLFLHLGVADELNPFMRLAYHLSPAWFVVAKLLAVQLGIAVLLSHRSHWLARFGLGLCASVYAITVLYHLAFAARMVG